jgi:hypothetical protein
MGKLFRLTAIGVGIVILGLAVLVVRHAGYQDHGQFELTVQNRSKDSLLDGRLITGGVVAHKLGALAPGSTARFVFHDVAEPQSYELTLEYSRRGKRELSANCGYPMKHDSTRVVAVAEGESLTTRSTRVPARERPYP